MTLRVEFIPAASQEIEDADDWFEARRVDLGLEFIQAVHSAAASAAGWPNAGQPAGMTAGGAAVRRVRVGRFPYFLAYVVQADRLVVVAIAHERRRPRYWIDRVD